MLLPIVAVIVYLLDWWSKSTVASRLDCGSPFATRTVIPGFLRITCTHNEHGAFGLFGDSPVMLIGLAVLVLVIFAYAFRDALKNSRLVQIAFGMIFGGAIANVIDRLQHHFVIDFIDFYRIWQFIFNVADSAITIGVALLIIGSFVQERRSQA